MQNAAYGQLRGALIMGFGHMQTSVAAAARRMWVATVDSTATSRGVRGEPGRPADINNAVGHRKTPQHCKERSAARATEGVRESSFLAPRCRVRVDTIGTSWRRRREAGCRRAEGPSVELLALPADCPGPRSWIRPGVALENGLGRSRAMRAKDARRPWRSAHPCRRSGDAYSRGRVLRCNLLPWGWYGEWEQDDDEAKATLERWVMGVRSRRNGAHRGRA